MEFIVKTVLLLLKNGNNKKTMSASLTFDGAGDTDTQRKHSTGAILPLYYNTLKIILQGDLQNELHNQGKFTIQQQRDLF